MGSAAQIGRAFRSAQSGRSRSAPLLSMPPSEDLEHVPEKTRSLLNPRQALDYDDHRERLIEWLHSEGKDPDQSEGLAEGTARNYASRLDKFYRWVWEEFDGYTTRITPAHADEYVDRLANDELRKGDGTPYSPAHKRKETDALEKLFEWRARKLDGECWEPPVTFSETSSNPPDVFSKAEREKLREAALEIDSIPAYNGLSPEERDRWKAHLAQKLGKPKSEVTPDDWERVNTSWKIPSLVWVALDAGLRPVEIERSRVGWLRLEKGVIHVPKREASKNRDHWEVALSERTVKALERWLDERENYTKYDGRDDIWLNRQGNPYQSRTLNYLLGKLCDAAGIGQENRDLTWYSIRHSTGTYLATEGDLSQAKAQLRHKSVDSTMQYAHPPVEERRNTLDELG